MQQGNRSPGQQLSASMGEGGHACESAQSMGGQHSRRHAGRSVSGQHSCTARQQVAQDGHATGPGKLLAIELGADTRQPAQLQGGLQQMRKLVGDLPFLACQLQEAARHFNCLQGEQGQQQGN